MTVKVRSYYDRLFLANISFGTVSEADAKKIKCEMQNEDVAEKMTKKKEKEQQVKGGKIECV